MNCFFNTIEGYLLFFVIITHKSTLPLKMDIHSVHCRIKLMSTAIVRAEITRFLKSPEPETLCISGAWGAGKTFLWQKLVREVEAVRELGMQRYAYVSLFGLNSLAELRNSLVENTIATEGTEVSPDASTLHTVLRHGENYLRKNAPLINDAMGFFRIKDAGNGLYRAAFLSVREQLICFDDLERAGDGLKMKDILGLASMLREQRGCKVVLLMNKAKAEDAQEKQFNEQLEKVVDTFLDFEPTSEEAVKIAIDGSDAVAVALRERIVALGITNIRVIKKIERWARQLASILTDNSVTIINQAAATVSLAGWCFLQPGLAPTIEFVENFDPKKIYSFDDKEIPVEEKEWRFILQRYGQGPFSQFDRLIVDGVSSGYFQKEKLEQAASHIEKRLERQSRNNRLSEAWRLYADSLAKDDLVLDAIEAAAAENLADLTTSDMNEIILFLRHYDRSQRASALVASWIHAARHNSHNFSPYSTISLNRPFDPELKAAIESEQNTIRLDPVEMLKATSKNRASYAFEVGPALSKLSSKELVDMFDALPEDIKSMAMCAHELAQQYNHSLRANLDAALLEIAGRSKMNADRLRQWGILPD